MVIPKNKAKFVFSSKYEEIDPVAHTDAEQGLRSDNPQSIARTLIAIGLHVGDWRWGQQQALNFLSHENENVVSAAILSLAHSARVNRVIDRTTAIPALEKLAADPRFTGKVQDALDDISASV